MFWVNGTLVAGNLRIFALGRLAAHDPAALAAELHSPPEPVPLNTLNEILASRTRLLTRYQNTGYARQYRAYIDGIRQRADACALEGGDVFVRQVALTLARLMAYKDEYEVARLYSDPLFTQRLREQFSGDFKLGFSLAPPMLPGSDPSGRPKKREFGPWIVSAFGLLQHFKFLRGTVLDPFGYSRERRMERQLIADYCVLIDEVVDVLHYGNLQAAIELAGAAAEIAGYGPVKDASVERYATELERLLAAFRSPVMREVSVDLLQVRELL